MLTLRTNDILKSISWTFDEYILPNVDEAYAKSLALTISNLLRYAKLRVEKEGPLLYEDNNDLRNLLGEIAEAIDGALSGFPLSGLKDYCHDIRSSLNKTYCPPKEYQNLDHLIEEALALRGTLTRVIKALIDVEEKDAKDPNYARIREDIRKYLARQLHRESQSINGAFTGPRR